jgi:hypothetical protein
MYENACIFSLFTTTSFSYTAIWCGITYFYLTWEQSVGKKYKDCSDQNESAKLPIGFDSVTQKLRTIKSIDKIKMSNRVQVLVKILFFARTLTGLTKRRVHNFLHVALMYKNTQTVLNDPVSSRHWHLDVPYNKVSFNCLHVRACSMISSHQLWSDWEY